MSTDVAVPPDSGAALPPLPLVSATPVPPDAAETAPPEAQPSTAEGLTRRASLTAVASLLDYSARLGTSLVVTPILVHGLGSALYGVWEMLSRLTGYMSATDGRPTEALRLIISQHQDDPDTKDRRRFIGAAVVVWLLMLPLILLVGAALVWVVGPRMIHAPAGHASDVTRTMALLVVAFMLTGLGDIPDSVLRGMNLGYKRMGLQASLHALNGAMCAFAVWYGLGVPGLGASQAIRQAVGGIVFLVLTRKYVPWFGADRPAARDVRTLYSMSVWLSAGDMIAKLVLASDVLVLGAFAGPAIVATYALTGYAARTATGIQSFTAGAAIPGLGGLLGAGQHERAGQAYRELVQLTWLFTTITGTAVLLWNHAFLGRWVGASHYAGTLVNLLIVLAAAQTAYIRTDAYVLDAALKPKLRVMVGAIAAGTTLLACIALTRLFGLPGLCIGMLIGRAVQSIGYPIMAHRCIGATAPRPGITGSLLRYVGTTALLYTTAAWLGARLAHTGWIVWVPGVLATLPLVAFAALVLGPDREARRKLLRRLERLAKVRR